MTDRESRPPSAGGVPTATRRDLADTPTGPVADPSTTRRRVLVSLPAITLAGCFSNPVDDSDESESDVSGPPFEVRTIDAPGSDAGAVSLPESGTVTVCNFTRTACPTSESHLDVIGRAFDRIDDDDRVRFLSLIEYGRDPTSDDDAFADWWAEHAGGWPLGIDDDRVAFSHYEIDHTPSTVVLGGDGTVLLDRTGTETPGDIVRAVDEGLDAMVE
ncbi:TlpA family protein disulfide reductase [Halovivax gelatinilyticus]|uniref:TlpA family protein disulfide reductase n=1 Tax=Halovivax gelatinilyticus TaxID=2961597 RepID=UPI0020CA666B|nr:TlpA family protein disulfide reductase [Halovivax gelatinilyticus]